ncbi:MAG TPA: MFS transporter [Trueperaceae bacterium]|jgi:MFS family permease
MRLSLVEGGLVQVFLNWTSGSVLIGYLLALGAAPWHIALVGSVPFLAQVASPLGALAAEALGRRRVLAAAIAATSRLLWLLAAFLPQLVPSAVAPTALVAVVFLAGCFQAANGTVWTAWMGDVVPEDRRGRYFGLRTGVLGVVGMLANLAAGAFLDAVAPPLSFRVVILVGVGCALVGVALLLLHHDPPTERRRLRLGQLLAQPFREPNFRRFLRFAVYWHLVVMLGAPFVVPYFLEELGMTFTQVAIWSSIAAVTSLGSTILWGRVADAAGNKAVLAIGTFLAGAMLPANWILAGLTGNLVFIWVSAFFDAVAWGAITPAIFNLALVSAPRSGRVSFVAAYSLATGVAGFVGGALSGPLLGLFTSFGPPAILPGWSGYHTLFAVSALGRVFAWTLLRRVAEERAWRTRDLLRSARTAWKGTGLPWR